MNMHNPPHPGEILKDMYLEPLDLTITQTAKSLNISRQTLSELINGSIGISPGMAMRLAKAFNTTPELWVQLQSQYDLYQIQDIDLSMIKCLIRKKSYDEKR